MLLLHNNFNRLGSTILLELSKEKSLSLKLSAKLPNDIHSIDIKSQYDANLLNINGSLAYTFGFPSTTWTTQLQVRNFYIFSYTWI